MTDTNHFFETLPLTYNKIGDAHDWWAAWVERNLMLAHLSGRETRIPLTFASAPYAKSPESCQKLVDFMCSLPGARRVNRTFFLDGDTTEYFVWDNGVMSFVFEHADDQLNFSFATLEESEMVGLAEVVDEWFETRKLENSGRVYVLVSTPGGVEAHSLGYAAHPISMENYDPKIHPQIQNVIRDLNSSVPSGRLALFEGPPGSGKTFLIRGLVSEVKKATFIFIPPAMIPSLGDPSLVGTLTNLSSNNGGGGPVILICEDADSILTKRAADNMSAVSSLLNLTSGLMGDLLDIRVVATTNAKKTEIDEALVRSGRLSEYVQVQRLSDDYAYELLTKLLTSQNIEVPARETLTNEHWKKSHRDEKGSSLANVYALARSLGWVAPSISGKEKDPKLSAKVKRGILHTLKNPSYTFPLSTDSSGKRPALAQVNPKKVVTAAKGVRNRR
jgi:hypothetical protein